MTRSRALLGLGLALALLLPSAAFPSAAHAARILFVADASADGNIPGVLAADGHEVESIAGDFAQGNVALRGDLSGYGAVFWSATGTGSGDVHSDPTVFANLRAYVERGGRLFVTGYDSIASPTDPQLIELLGGSSSTDVPQAPTSVAQIACSLTTGRFDIRGVVPVPTSSDRDTLGGLAGDTLEIVGTSGGGGAQWTLRRLGAGEIAYVSHGMAESATEGWAMASSDGTGAYGAALLNFASAAGAALPIARGSDPALPPSGTPSPRRARVMSLAMTASAVLVAPDRAWLPPQSEQPLTLCAHDRCRPVREVSTCSVPACPGEGWLVIATERVADVSEYPHDRGAWLREREVALLDPELAPLGPSFGMHPEPAPAPPRPPRFVRSAREWASWEIGVQGGLAMLATSPAPLAAISLSAGVRFTPPEVDGPLDLLYGTSFGIDTRVTLLPGIRPQSGDVAAVMIGLAPQLAYAFPRDVARIPSLFGWMIPEVGLAVRTDGAPVAFYAQWNLSAAALIDDHFGFEARASLAIIDDWIPGDDVEGILTLSAGLVLR